MDETEQFLTPKITFAAAIVAKCDLSIYTHTEKELKILYRASLGKEL